MKSLHILTLNWNGSERIQKLHNSLLPCLPENWMWWIRDNGSADDSIKTIVAFNNPRIVLKAYPNNLSNYAEGNNWLANHAQPEDDEYILLLNNDIVFNDTTSIKKMMDILDNDQEVGIVGCKLNYEDRPDTIQHAGVLFHPVSSTPYHYRAGKKEETRDRKNRYYPVITGAVLLIRASLWKELNGLEEAFRWSWEDSDLCMRAREKGSKVVYCGETQILHSESASLKKNPVNQMFFSQNLKLFTSRWKDKMDKSLVKKYEQDQNYEVYKGKR